MKKIIALLLIFCMSLSILPVFASDTELPDRTTEVNELKTLGIIEESVSDFDGTKTISRGNFAKRITRLLNMIPEHIYYEDIYYYDVPEEHEYFLEIMHCAKMSWMSGYGNNMFLPENEITLGEALKVLISVLGYDYKAEAQGGYVTGYITVANELGLLKGIKSVYTDTLILNDFVKLLDNALTVPLAVASGIKDDDGIIYDINPDVTVLSRYHDSFKGTGVVTSNDTVVIEGMLASENEIIVNGLSLKLKNVMDRNYIGCKVDYIYKVNKLNGDKELVTINDAGTKKVEIELKNFENLSGNTFYYTTEGEKTSKLDISGEALFIKNGEVVKNPSASLFNKEKIGTVSFIQYKKSDYDLVVIREYDSFVVGKINNNDYLISDFSDYTNSYSLDEENKKVIITDANGNKLDFKGIKVNTVVSVAEGANKEVIEVIVSESVVSGLFESKNDTEKIVTIAGNEYKVKNLTVMAASFLGSKVSVYVDAFGYIVFAESVSEDGYTNAIYLKSVDRTFENENVIIAKFYMLDGTIKEVKVSDKVSINGERRNNLINEILTGEFAKTGITNPLVKVKFNDAQDEITNILIPKKRSDLLALPTEDGFCVASGSYVFSSIGSHFGLNIYTNNNTPFVQVPASVNDVTSEDFVLLKGTKNFTNGISYNITAYFDSKLDLSPIFVQIPDGTFKADMTSTSTMGIVSKFTETVDEYGQRATKIYLYQDGKEISYILKNDNVVDSKSGTYYAKDLKIGDAVVTAVDSKGQLNSFIYLYSTVNATIPYTSEGVANTNSWALRTITALRNGYVELKDSSDNIYRMRTGDASIYLVTGSGLGSASVKKGTIDDLFETDTIFYFMVNGVPKALVKYQ